MKKVALFFAFVVIALFFACQKDISEIVKVPVSKQNFMNVNKAKEWFDETEPKTVWTKTEKQEHYVPQWDLALQLNGAVEVPVLLEDKIIRPTINVDNPKLHGVTRLLIARLDGHSIDAAIIKYFPSEKFVGNIEEINRDNFREKKFDGMIKLENFDFTDQKVVLIENGELKYFMGKNLKHDPNKEDYTVCFPAQVCQSVSVPSAGYYGPTTCSFDGSYYCVIVPTDYNNNVNTNTSSTSGNATGINMSGAGILGGGTITPIQKLCAEALPELKTLESIFGGYTQTSGLINVNIELKRQPLVGGTFNLNFPYLTFHISRGVDPFPAPIPNANTMIANAFNQAITDTQKDIMLFNEPIITSKEDAQSRFLLYLNDYLTNNLGHISQAQVLDLNPNALFIAFGGSPMTPLSSVQTQDTSIPNAPCKK